MGFYAARVSRDGARLTLGMRTGLRISLVAAFGLALASLALDGRWLALGTPGKLGSALVTLALGAAAAWRDDWILDRRAGTLALARGAWPFVAREVRPLSALLGVELSAHGVRRPGFGEERRAGLFLLVEGRTVVLERSMPYEKARLVAAALAAFAPPPFETRST